MFLNLNSVLVVEIRNINIKRVILTIRNMLFLKTSFWNKVEHLKCIDIYFVVSVI